MTRVVYVNGRYLPYAEAGVHVEDRGFQFADAIYEVCEIRDGRLVDETRHMDRLERSLGELAIAKPMSRRALGLVMREVVRRNRIRTGLLYLQVTRGAAPRDFPFPQGDVTPTLVCLARRVDDAKREARAAAGIAVATQPDIRWARCDIKTVMLLPAVLAKEAAAGAGAQEAWLVDSAGFVTEGASSNAWIVDGAGTLITRPTGNAILPGVTRRTLLDLLSREKIPLTERAFTVEEALAAREAFITSASGTVMPVVSINKVPIGSGHPGTLTLRLRSIFHQVAELSH
ncbi:D-amino-acid transaminase [Hyphomicrobium sp.]|uniref:D-amino-acid transaminase n=1 Tax=Hyphomicrobium sp. TaxID=82 RepID=UPI0025BAD879|nr:D-amino-acid transaminase [Hyphomicrobium sp.]MCC7253801.1 D-amino-acid transaminase [Hyphomicrobium sp.]